MTTHKSQHPARQRMQPLRSLEGAACTPLYMLPAWQSCASDRAS
ncbi:MAG: hypothetical protein ACUVT2_05675 [Thiobacillaceae bacterium]